MKRCYIHLGIHKTGSTAIQHALGKGRDFLLQENIYVPRAGMAAPDVAAHHHIAFELNDPKRFEPAKGGMSELAAELRAENPATVVLSTEAFCWTVSVPSRLPRLREPLLELGYELHWIVYFRSYPEWAESAYTQLAKTLSVTRPFDEWVLDADRPLVLGLDPDRVVEGIRATGDRIHLRSYSMALPDLIGDFMAQIGVHREMPAEMKSSQRVNLRPQVLKMEFLRRAAVRAKSISRPGVRQAFIRKALRILPSLPASPSYRGLSLPLALQLHEQTRPQYERLLADYRPDVPFDVFFPLADTYQDLHIGNYECPPEHRTQLEKALADLGA